MGLAESAKDYFDWPWPVHSVYINLNHRADRRREFNLEAKTMGITVHRLEATQNARGFMGCTASHIRALQHCLVRLQQGFALVFEDDFGFRGRTPNWRQHIVDFWDEHPDANVLMLSSNPYKMFPTEGRFAKVDWALTTSGYMVRRRYIPTLLANFQQALHKQTPLDVHWQHIQKDGTWYACQPALGIQRPSYSDIEQRHTDYGV